MGKILCKDCFCAVDCGGTYLCLMEPLFTYTSKKVCTDYKTGNPISEEEFEDYNNGKKYGVKK